MSHQRIEEFGSLGGAPDKGHRDRSRFDAAHELGHLVLHSPEEAGSKDAETQAHQFAAAFLMPADDIADDLPSRMLTLVVDGEPLDEVIVNWKLELQRAIRRLYTDPDPTQAEPPRLESEAPDRPGEPDIVYLTRLAGTITVTSTAIETGRHLLTDDLRTNLALNRANGTARTEHPAGANGVAINGAVLTASAQSAAGQPAQRPAALDPNLRPPAPVHSVQPGPTLRSDR